MSPETAAPPPTEDACHSLPIATNKSQRPATRRCGYVSWNVLLRQLGIDVGTCPRCQGKMKVIALVRDPESIPRYLRHRGLPTEEPSIVPARGPPLWASGCSPVPRQHAILVRRLQGHDAYYGVTGNYACLRVLRHWVERIWFKWLRRRSWAARRKTGHGCGGCWRVFRSRVRASARLNAQRTRDLTNWMREIRTSGSVAASGGTFVARARP